MAIQRTNVHRLSVALLGVSVAFAASCSKGIIGPGGNPNPTPGSIPPDASSPVDSAPPSEASTVQVGTAAPLGNPTSTLFNGLLTLLDPYAHTPIHSFPATIGTMPTALAGEKLPYLPKINVLARRDTIILYFPNIAGAADYRAYAVADGVSFTSTPNGMEPRGTVVACAGYRQHSYESNVVSGNHTRQLLQSIEIPGFIPGYHTLVLEALKSPCPFPGMIGHTDAVMTMASKGSTNAFNAADPVTYTYTGVPKAIIKSYDSIMSEYGNEILNGQGAAGSMQNLMTENNGLDVAAGDATIPSDPVVLARSVVTVPLPFTDESVIAPIIDVGPNSVVDDFTDNLVVDPSTITQNPDYPPSPAAAPMFQIPDKWAFWGRLMNNADGQGIVDGKYSVMGMLGMQVFQRYGRMYTVFGDAGEDVGGSLSFSSLATTPLQMDATRFIHSRFRISTEGTQRRYWYWTLCGGATAGELYDASKKEYQIRPLLYESSFGPGGDNPSFPNPAIGGPTMEASAKECLSIALEGRPEPPRTDGFPRASSVIRAQIHPAGIAKGIIALGNTSTDQPVASGPSSLGFRYLVTAAGKYNGPVLEPFDQMNPLTHFDVFVRPDQLIVFINGRQGICVDMSDRPLTMNYAMIGYGDLIYHSSIEWEGIAAGLPSSQTSTGPGPYPSQLYQYLFNTPIASTRIWDEVGHTEMIDVPAQLPAYTPSLCMNPATTAVQ